MRRCFGPAAEIYVQVTLEHGDRWDDGSPQESCIMLYPEGRRVLELHTIFKTVLGKIDIERFKHVGRK